MANVSQVKAQFATDVTATSTTTIAAAQTLGGAGNMTLTGAAATFGGTGSSQKVSLTCAANMSGVTFTITGTDSKGDAQSEDLTGPNANTVFSTKYYNTVTQIAASGAVGTNTSAGVLGGSSGLVSIIFGGRTRIRGMHGVLAGAGNLTFKDSSASGTALLTLSASAGDLDPYIPDDGVLFPNGAYLVADQGDITGLTVFYDG
jgi:hypothetical protein